MPLLLAKVGGRFNIMQWEDVSGGVRVVSGRVVVTDAVCAVIEFLPMLLLYAGAPKKSGLGRCYSIILFPGM